MSDMGCSMNNNTILLLESCEIVSRIIKANHKPSFYLENYIKKILLKFFLKKSNFKIGSGRIGYQDPSLKSDTE